MPISHHRAISPFPQSHTYPASDNVFLCVSSYIPPIVENHLAQPFSAKCLLRTSQSSPASIYGDVGDRIERTASSQSIPAITYREGKGPKTGIERYITSTRPHSTTPGEHNRLATRPRSLWIDRNFLVSAEIFSGVHRTICVRQCRPMRVAATTAGPSSRQWVFVERIISTPAHPDSTSHIAISLGREFFRQDHQQTRPSS
nr:hypothetical protein CFP56_75499 [Quercus suber]